MERRKQRLAAAGFQQSPRLRVEPLRLVPVLDVNMAGREIPRPERSIGRQTGLLGDRQCFGQVRNAALEVLHQQMSRAQFSSPVHTCR